MFKGERLGSAYTELQSAFYPVAIMFILIFLFFIFKLKTYITNTEVTYNFFPFHLKSRVIPLNNIANMYVRKYKPLREYGGWGVRMGLFGKGSAINVSGNMGIQIELKNGDRILIGTNKPDDAKRIIKDLQEQYHWTEKK